MEGRRSQKRMDEPPATEIALERAFAVADERPPGF
jgi:hypothetical protein